MPKISFLLLGLVTLAAASSPAQEINLFNGRDLTGWAGVPSLWSVKDGAITGKLTNKNNPGGNTFLVWQGGEVADFEFSCKYRLTAENPEGMVNSGVQFRAVYTNQERFDLRGYQGEMDPGTNHPDLYPEGGGMNGCLMDDPKGSMAHVGQRVVVHPGAGPKGTAGICEVTGQLAPDAVYRKLYRKGDWNDYRIVAVGNHFQIFVNGQQTVDVVDQANRFTSGWIALQMHSYNRLPKTVQFKDIKLKRLQGGVIASLPAAPASNSSPTIAPSAPSVVAVQTDSSQSRVDVLKEQAPNAIEWVLAPLDQGVPGDIRQNLMFLREDLLDEGKQKPKASTESYALGSQICATVLAVLEERNQTQARAGFRAVEANARTGVGSEALEARRNYKMSWPQFAREESQRAELKSQAVSNAAVMSERPKLDWVARTAVLRKSLDDLYGKFRDALRQSPAVK